MRDLDQEDVAILRLGLRQVRQLVAGTAQAGVQLPGIGAALHEVRTRVAALEEALAAPGNQLITPARPPKEPPEP